MLANPRYRAPHPASQDIRSLISAENQMPLSEALDFPLRLLYHVHIPLDNE